MRNPFQLDIPPRAAAVVVALALLASIVTGGEKTSVPVSPPTAIKAVEQKEDLDFDPASMERKPREGEVQDLFASRAPAAAPAPSPAPIAAAKLAPPPPSTAPPLPFKYVGHMTKRGKLTVFVEKNQNAYSLAAGDVLENAYKVESLDESAVVFTYLPLGQRQTLQVPAPQ